MDSLPRLLFVDDEPNIRLTLAAILKHRGFAVTTAATVPEALNFVATQKFDVLISDLNIGEPGDGFTVVSAMRRTQPEAATFILTGYPAFESALEAIRQQVDDYFVKPADVRGLVDRIYERLSNPPAARHRIETRRLAEILNENRREIFTRWMATAQQDEEVGSTTLSAQELADGLPSVIDEIISRESGRRLSAKGLNAAQRHGSTRFQQGCSIPLIIREGRILHEVISRLIQEHLLAIDTSFLITDIMATGETIQGFVEESIRSFVQARHSFVESGSGHKGQSVLLLSADRELSLLREYALEHASFAVARADSRQQAWQLLDSAFEALVISYSLSPDDMVEMTKQFRKRNPSSPIIGITKGKWQDLNIDVDFTVSGDDGPQGLLEVLENALTRRQLRRVK